MLKKLLKSFLPWILFFVLASFGHALSQINIAISVAAITGLIFELNDLKQGFLLSWVTLIFFVFMFIAIVILKFQAIVPYLWIFSNATLAFIAWASLLIGKPFTLQYAKKQVSQDKWQHPIFITINNILTMTWGIIFLLNLALHLLQFYFPIFPPALFELFTYLPSIFGIWFTIWFPSFYRSRKK